MNRRHTPTRAPLNRVVTMHTATPEQRSAVTAVLALLADEAIPAEDAASSSTTSALAELMARSMPSCAASERYPAAYRSINDE